MNKHISLNISSNYRLIAISDIHSHLDRFKELLEKVNYTTNDYLVIVGDFVEKGTQAIQLVQYLMFLQQQSDRVYVLKGNCEIALEKLVNDEYYANQMIHYIKHIGKSGMIDQALTKLNINRSLDNKTIQCKVRKYLKPYLDYINSLPISLHFNQFLFIHAGIENRKDWYNSSLSSMLETKTFYLDGHCLNDYVVVGHIPTSNYFNNKINNDILINHDKKIICLDGGTGVKMISQLNSLVIESNNNSIRFFKQYVQPLNYYEVIEDIKGKKSSLNKIAWPYFEIEIINEGLQFTTCKQLVTDKVISIKNEFIYHKNNKYYCLDDYVDNFLSIKKGSIVKLIGIYDNYAYIIYNQEVGWVPYSCLKER